MALASLGGIPFHAGPSDIRWQYQMKTSTLPTLGGKVVQILGVSLGDMTLTGRFGVNRAKGDTEAWQDQVRFRDQVKEWSEQADAQRSPRPLRFVYPPRNWDFKCFVKTFSDVTHDIHEIAPEYTIVLHLLEDSTKKVIKDVKDLYLKRLMDGVGWKQTSYNGPTEGDVAELLDGKTIGEYLASEAQKAFESGLPGGSIDAP